MKTIVIIFGLLALSGGADYNNRPVKLPVGPFTIPEGYIYAVSNIDDSGDTSVDTSTSKPGL